MVVCSSEHIFTTILEFLERRMREMKKLIFVLITVTIVAMFVFAGCGCEHEYVESITKEPSCDVGIKTFTCSLCQDTYTEDIPAIAQHKFGKWKITKAGSCTEKGEQTRTCSACGVSETQESPTVHNWIEPTCLSARTCADCGLTTGTIGQHSWRDATCTDEKYCKVCEMVIGKKLGHTADITGRCIRCSIDMSINIRERIGAPDESIPFGFSFYKNAKDEIKLNWVAKNISGRTISSFTVKIYFRNAAGKLTQDSETRQNNVTLTFNKQILPDEMLEIYQIIGEVPECAKITIGEIMLNYAIDEDEIDDDTVIKTEVGKYDYSTSYHNKWLA